MTAADLHSMFVQETWNFFVSVHMAVIGLMFIARGSHIPFFARLLVLPGYAAFMYINYQAQVDNYAYTAEILQQLHVAGNGGVSTSMFRVGWVRGYLQMIYAGAAALSVLVMLGVSFLPGSRDTTSRHGDM